MWEIGLRTTEELGLQGLIEFECHLFVITLDFMNSVKYFVHFFDAVGHV